MSTDDRAGLEMSGTDDRCIDDRTRRALEQHLTVTPDVGPARGADGLAIVTSQSGREYLVDLEAGTCGRTDGDLCPDQEYNLDDGEPCKHVIRGRIATGRRPVSTAELAAADVVPDLGAHAAGPRVVTSDGGIIEAGDGAEILDADGGADSDGEDVVDLAEETGDAPAEAADERPDECECTGASYETDPCWYCYAYGFDEPNPDAGADSDAGTEGAA